MKPWTKREVKAMLSAIETFKLKLRPLGTSSSALLDFHVNVTAYLSDPLNAKEVVVVGLEELRGIAVDRAKTDRDTATHAKEHPGIWGRSTEEIVNRFTKLAEEDEKAMKWFTRLLARIEAMGLPEEVTKNFSLDNPEKVW